MSAAGAPQGLALNAPGLGKNAATLSPAGAEQAMAIYAAEQAAQRKKALNRQHWLMCAQLSVQLVATIPLPSISLRALLAMQQGHVVLSSWSAREDVPLMAGDTFLANVSFEASGSSLAVRISDFDRRTSGIQAASQQAPRKGGMNLPEGSDPLNDLHYAMNDILLPTSICFGIKSMLVQQILDLAVGDAIILDRPVTAQVSVLAAGRVVAHGDLVAVKHCFGVRLSSMAELSKRLPFFHASVQGCGGEEAAVAVLSEA